jgi:hypothetical protein
MAALRIAAASATLALVAAHSAAATPSNGIGVDTTIISHSTTGGLANGPSGHASMSLDARFATMLAFDSTATDLVQEPTGGGSNVYFTNRETPFDDTGSPWVAGPIQIASRGLGGKPADGPSTLPAVGGDNQHAPACIAFISAAHNLVKGDTNGKPDAFAFFPGPGKTIRVSVGKRSKQANGAATDVAVNGRCTKFAFADDATNLAGHPPAHTSQIYQRDLQAKRTITVTVMRHGHKVHKHKSVVGPLTSLVSKRAGRAGNADSSSPVFAVFTDDIAFASRATNLAADTRGFSQVYGVGRKLGNLRLLSVTADGAPGDGDSDQPVLSQSAKGYAFRTRAPNLGSPGPEQIVYSRVGVPLRPAGPPATVDQSAPTMANQGHYAVFESGGEADLWTDVTSQIVLLSRNSQQKPLTFPAFEPVTSEATNYVAFTTRDPFADGDFAAVQPGWDDDAAATQQRARDDPSYQQVYLRYFGGAS